MIASDAALQAALLESGHALHRRDHPDLFTTIQRHHRLGDVALVLPGTYVTTAYRHDPTVLARAALSWRPDAVLTGAIAAHLTFWPQLRPSAIEIALPGRPRSTRPGFRLTERRIPPELVATQSGLRLSTPALTCLDLVPDHDGDAVDRALRRRATTLPLLHEALTATSGRRHNTDRRLVLLDSRDEPWSGAERVAHRIFRAAGITGWLVNLRVDLDQTYFLDIAFRRVKLAIEIDGRAFHTDAEAFEADRHRQNQLVLAGWRVLRFTWLMLTEQPERCVAIVGAALG